MSTLFKPTLDDRVADCPSATGVDTAALLNHFGPDVTWRTVLRADNDVLCALPGYGPRTVERLRSFMCQNIDYTFQDFLL